MLTILFVACFPETYSSGVKDSAVAEDSGGDTGSAVDTDTSVDDTSVEDPGVEDTSVEDTGQPAGAGSLVITEIMKNPHPIADELGEWFEIHNLSGGSIDLSGVVVSDLTPESFDLTGTIPAGGYFVAGNNADAATNGGVTVDFEYGAAFQLSSDEDEIILTGPEGEIDRVAYTKEFPDVKGISLSLDPTKLEATANDSSANWCGATTALGEQFGTPGAANDACEK